LTSICPQVQFFDRIEGEKELTRGIGDAKGLAAIAVDDFDTVPIQQNDFVLFTIYKQA
jgi:hypothetical protein